MTLLVTLDRHRPVRKAELDPRLALAAVDELLGFARLRLAKAQLPAAVRARDELLAEAVPTFREELVSWYAGLVREAGIRKVDELGDPDAVDWSGAEDDVRDILAGLYAKLGSSAYAAVARQLSIELAFDLEAAVAKPIRELIAAKVTGITATAQEVIRRYIETAVERGYSVAELVDGVESAGFLGLSAIFGERAQVIALTETATAYNRTSTQAYRESGLVDTVLVFDGPECGWTEHDDPDLADGSTRTLDEADEYPTSHPNCQRAFGPIAAGEAD